MKRNHEIIIEPLITEKSTILKEESRVYCFKVANDATKVDVKTAVEHIFKVDVDSVRIANYKGKMKRLGRNIGKRADWKKAWVKLSPTSKTIEYFEGT
jgi:large subunit ribosomal protein L23